MTKYITLDKPLLDWITVTSYEPLTHDLQSVLLSLVAAMPGAKGKSDSKWLQYIGYSVSCDSGTLFCGYGTQKGSDHWAIRVSGELCNEREVINPLMAGISESWLRVTRIDFQVTIEEPQGWDSWRLFNRAKLMRKTVGWVQSEGETGQLSTCYIGSRQSEKFLRVYQKESGNSRFLRCEYELKGNTAHAYAKMLARGEATNSQLLLNLIQQTGIDLVSEHYEPILAYSNAVKPKVVRLESKTEKWLLETVLPAFDRWAHSHDADLSILARFYEVHIDVMGLSCD